MKMFYKKLLLFFLVLFIMIVDINGYAEAGNDYGHAEVHLVSPDLNKNVNEVNLFGNSETPQYETINGRTWLVIGGESGESVNAVGIDFMHLIHRKIKNYGKKL